MKTGLEERYVLKNNKKLRLGYTTGSCAAAAAKGAAQMLLSKERITQTKLMTPRGILLTLELLDVQCLENRVSCAVRKDGGDDPDMTNGMLIYAEVEKCGHSQKDRVYSGGQSIAPVELILDGGKGIGRITRPGLEQPVGEAAINRVPRMMILKEVEAVCEQYGYEGCLKITIFAPMGEEIAAKTFNPRLGIVGGISILGTSGIVEPMSEAALIKSIEIEMDMRIAQGESYLLVTPGNYGRAYLEEEMPLLPFEKAMKCSNYVGETLDMALSKGVKGILFVSHIGKFVKVAAGIMNTHSRQADARMEVLAGNAARTGAELESIRAILNCQTTDEALEVLHKTPYFQKTMEEIVRRIQFYLDHHTYGQILTGAVVFSNVYGFLGKTDTAAELIKILSQRKELQL